MLLYKIVTERASKTSQSVWSRTKRRRKMRRTKHLIRCSRSDFKSGLNGSALRDWSGTGRNGEKCYAKAEATQTITRLEAVKSQKLESSLFTKWVGCLKTTLVILL
ncbi:hypothetical protein GWI33_007792 [Rhynchophorus ferrugineus]|uniref:Uncharacterized protein n=1 Tax=Rhynchophorus ferrugineus TaxID=354439 RepID=A0A834ID07_RHYFE|nr:hypothetical protein GWI33_007792 [Rhynchophorus ferrugineus]